MVSQSLHFLRAFQHSQEIETIAEAKEGRNPFIFLGHFNRNQKSYREEIEK